MTSYQVDVLIQKPGMSSGSIFTCWDIEARNRNQAEIRAFKYVHSRYGYSLTDLSLSSIKENYSSSSSSNSSSDAGTGLVIGLFQLAGWGIATTATVGYLGVTKVAYPATKFVVTKAVVPATIFTGKYTWKGMNYVATTTVPQVYSFTKNTIIPGVIKVAGDIVTFIKELIQKVLNK